MKESAIFALPKIAKKSTCIDNIVWKASKRTNLEQNGPIRYVHLLNVCSTFTYTITVDRRQSKCLYYQACYFYATRDHFDDLIVQINIPSVCRPFLSSHGCPDN